MEATAKLKKLPISARKIGLLAALIRGKSVAMSLAILQNKPQQAAVQLRKLLLSAISNWQNSHATSLAEEPIFVKRITVDRAGMLKRIMPAPRGVAHRIRKRSSHVVIVVDSAASVADVPHEVVSSTKT
ncbi:50S ribosomal protein L22 [Candidatus Cardinium sp. TP]|uniref:50S ribosomal protein L22 n=1 Tax=Candidatus Cardinium sp. TP TaxID=2961955 RepID=UPI0021AF1BE9|nr:50S ribosomal protein L22 [Candidatus Cardinium sp. TP]MCT4697059.1 50S ribosomal protein L22 [Candidatus Cardinium sp. TP]MDN5246647.1 50S ribosomal protein L22 [Candidatus Cardinium sp.]